MKPTVFIQTNAKQMIGAKVAAYTFKRNSKAPDSFDVRFIHLDDYPRLKGKHGRPYIRKGMPDTWNNDDLQSFTPLRFLPPQLMNYQGTAVVTDPDVFSLPGKDIAELVFRPMNGKAVICRKVIDKKFSRGHYWGTSVMLLDCAKLTHWDWDKTIEDLFAKKIDYRDWMSLYLEDESTLGELEEYWNSYDILNEETRLLHNTGRLTQPWKTGLPIDFSTAEKSYKAAASPAKKILFKLLGRTPAPPPAPKKSEKSNPTIYREHPDVNQERFFFQMLNECIAKGIITKQELEDAMHRDFVRHDAFAVLQKHAA